ncbi:MAG TPA: hypothetical protein VFT46_09845 [Holophagaceae bacterium]|nr:hypothetical protein [Holophagaceae bacterium]
MTKPLVPVDLLKSLAKAQKADEESGAKPAPKAKPAPAASVKVNTKAQGKGNAMHTRSSNRGK